MIKILLLILSIKYGIENLHLYEKVFESEIQNIYENCTKDLRAKQINTNFDKTEEYCLMNKFTPENVGELFNKTKNPETYSELVRCLKYIEKVFMFDLFK